MALVQAASPGRLKRDALSLRHVIASTLANIAPAMSIFFGLGVIVAGAGVAAPLTIAVAMVAVLFLANTLSEFCRYRPSTGSFVTFMGLAFGPIVAAAAALFLVFGYVVAASSVVCIAGGWTHDTLHTYLGLDIPWQAISVAACLAIGLLVSRGVAISTVWAAVFLYFELGLLLIGAVLMLAGSAGFLSAAPFLPANLSGGLAGIGLGFPLAVYLFVGWENSATLAEETTDPRSNLPRALFTGVLSIGVLYLFLTYAIEIAFHGDAAAVGKSDLPFVDALRNSAGPGVVVVAYLAGLTSIFSSLIGLTNSQARILFNSGREGLLPEFAGKLHPLRRTPARAMWIFIGLALALALGFGWNEPPVDYFGQSGSMGTIPLVLVYIGTNLALPVYMRRHHPAELSAFRHVLLPLLGTALMLLPLWGLVQPGQPAPFNLFPWIALAVLAASLLYGAILTRRNPRLADRIGSFVADE